MKLLSRRSPLCRSFSSILSEHSSLYGNFIISGELCEHLSSSLSGSTLIGIPSIVPSSSAADEKPFISIWINLLRAESPFKVVRFRFCRTTVGGTIHRFARFIIRYKSSVVGDNWTPNTLTSVQERNLKAKQLRWVIWTLCTKDPRIKTLRKWI